MTDTALTYADLVKAGKEHVAAIDAAWWELAALADKLPTVYGEHTLEKYTRDTGATCSLERRLTVWRCWKSAPGPILEIVKSKYSVARELASRSLPERIDIISRNPNITKREAQAIMRRLRGAQPKAETEPPTEPIAETEPPATAAVEARASTPTVTANPEPAGAASDLENTRRWWSDFRSAAHTVGHYKITPRFATASILRRAVLPPLLPIMRAELEGALKTVDFLQSLFAEVREAAE